MEFLINHTRKEIRHMTNMNENNIGFFLTKWAWKDDDDVEIVHMDWVEGFERILDLIEDEKYFITEEDRAPFAYDAVDLAYDYEDVMSQSSAYSCERGFAGWDEPGASFDW
jgi:hypothetical protein